MGQRVNFEAIPGTRFDQYVFKLRLVLGYLAQPGGTKFKGFRDFLRKQNMWDKDKSPVMLSLVDLSWDKTSVKAGKFAKQLANAHADADFQAALFERLKDVNILLVKYVMEALDVTQGGRLHSVHELYRLITSYVYPGAYIQLPAFQAWIDWLAASGVIKLVGIRWALSDKGQKIVSELRGMDLDEILEDMEDDEEEEDDEAEDEDEDDEEEAPAVRPAKPPLGRVTAAPAPKQAPQAARDEEDDDDEEDLFADLPPEAAPPDEGAIQAARSRLGLEGEDDEEEAPKPAKPRYTPPPQLAKGSRAPAGAVTPAGTAPHAASAAAAGGLHPPLPIQSASDFGVVLTARAEDAEVVARVVALWQAVGPWPSLTAPTLGVEYDAARGDLAILFELGVWAHVVEGLEAQPQVLAFARRLKATDFFAEVGRGGGLDADLEGLAELADEPWAHALVGRLAQGPFVARRLGLRMDLMYALRQAGSGSEVIALLREHLVGPNGVEAPFWVARELVRLEVVTTDSMRSVAAVPTAGLIRNAKRIGLVRGDALVSTEAYLTLVQAVVARLGGAETGYGEALAYLDRGLGLS